MAWQELVILAGSLFANAALIPTIRDTTSRVPFRTSAGTAGILLVQTSMFVSLGLVTTAIGTAIGTFCWFLILLLRSEWRGAQKLRATVGTAAPVEASGPIPTDD